jgi:hypothetical protein
MTTLRKIVAWLVTAAAAATLGALPAASQASIPMMSPAKVRLVSGDSSLSGTSVPSVRPIPLCLDVYGWSTANGAAVDQYPCLVNKEGQPDANQEWYLEQVEAKAGGFPRYRIVSANSPPGHPKCVEVYNWGKDSSGTVRPTGAKVDIWDCLSKNGVPDANQVWLQIPPAMNGTAGTEYENQWTQSTHQALDIGSHNVHGRTDLSHRDAGDLAVEYPFHGGANQIWAQG